MFAISEEEDFESNVHGGWSISLGEATERKVGQLIELQNGLIIFILFIQVHLNTLTEGRITTVCVSAHE